MSPLWTDTAMPFQMLLSIMRSAILDDPDFPILGWLDEDRLKHYTTNLKQVGQYYQNAHVEVVADYLRLFGQTVQYAYQYPVTTSEFHKSKSIQLMSQYFYPQKDCQNTQTQEPAEQNQGFYTLRKAKDTTGSYIQDWMLPPG